MRRLLWMMLGSALTLLACAIGWFMSGGWHTDELIVINYASQQTPVSVKDSQGNYLLRPTGDFISEVKYDMIPDETGFIVELDGKLAGRNGYAMKCDFGPQYLLITNDGRVTGFAMSNDTPDFLRRRLKCLLKFGK